MCISCHRAEGWGKSNGDYPQIAGQHASVTIKQLADIRAGNRDVWKMVPFTRPEKLGGVQEIADVAAYIASLPMTPENGLGIGNDLEYGEERYIQHCAGCHGQNGEGNAALHIPMIHGQHYVYLKRQFEWIMKGKRRNANPGMVQLIQGYTAREIYAVMDYVSRLRPPAEKLAPADWKNPDF